MQYVRVATCNVMLVKMVRRLGLVLCLLANLAYGQDNFLHKWLFTSKGSLRLAKCENVYRMERGEFTEVRPLQGYVEMVELTKPSFPVLNKFNTALEQFFLFQLYKLETEELLSEIPTNIPNISDPIGLSDQHNDDIVFKDVKVYGICTFPNSREVVHDSMGSATQFKAQTLFKSNVIIFNGFFVVSGSTHFFTYLLENNTYSWYYHAIRGLKDPQYFKVELQFERHAFLHTYGPTEENYDQINDTVTKKFIDILTNRYQSEIADLFNDRVKKLILQEDLKFIFSYEKKIVHSIQKMILVKELNSFSITPINFTSALSGPRKYVQIYKNIKVENVQPLFYSLCNEVYQSGIYSFPNSSVKLANDVKLSASFQFIYPERESQTLISFVIGDGRHENVKKFQVKNVTLSVAYKSTLEKRPFVVTRDKSVFNNNYGFDIQFGIEDFDPIYGFVIQHVGNDIARVFEETLLAEV